MNVVFPEMFEYQTQLYNDFAWWYCGNFIPFDAGVNQVFFDDGESTGVELFLYRVEKRQRSNSPSRDFNSMEAWFSWNVSEANANGIKLLQSVHWENLNAQLWPALNATSS